MIRTRFNLITKSSTHDADRLVGYADIPAVPSVGDLVNIDGEPYYCHSVAWGLNTEPTDEKTLYAYVRVLRA